MATFDPELREEGSVEVVDATAGVAVMLVVATVTPSVEAADC